MPRRTAEPDAGLVEFAVEDRPRFPHSGRSIRHGMWEHVCRGRSPGCPLRKGAFGMIFGYTTGVFDMFHIGHLRLLQRAKAECDQLIVGITTDELAREVKGNTPIVPFNERREIVSALRCVDLTVPQSSMDKLRAWESLRFDRMFVGSDWRGTERWNALERDFSAVGVEIVYFPYTDSTSSTRLREALDLVHGQDA